MSRILSQTLLHRASLCPPTAIISHRRHSSTKTPRTQLMEVDLDTASSSPQPDLSDAAAAAEVISFGIKKLEEAIQSIIVNRASPDWLPFLPGYSYWVPPRAAAKRNHPAGAMIDAIGKLASSNHGLHRDLLTKDERMSLISARGWPSSAFFIHGNSPIHPIPLVELHLKVQDNEHKLVHTSSSEDEEDEP